VSVEIPRVTPDWLSLREPADAAARSAELVDLVRPWLSGSSPVVIHDLGCGTGSMARWLAPRLGLPQHWVMYDRDADLLEYAAGALTGPGARSGARSGARNGARSGADPGARNGARDGASNGDVTVETRQCDIAGLTAQDLAGADLVTASALLDLLTADEVDGLAGACAGAGCPALLTLSVIGDIDLEPIDQFDDEITAAFNAHQRRTIGHRRLLGPDAVEVAVAAFARRGIPTAVRASDWRLDAGSRELLVEWFDGWLGAACEQRPELAGPDVAGGARAYARTRLAQASDGALRVVVRHQDLLAGPVGAGPVDAGPVDVGLVEPASGPLA
jgi:SAM-dependent methyltransferase